MPYGLRAPATARCDVPAITTPAQSQELTARLGIAGQIIAQLGTTAIVSYLAWRVWCTIDVLAVINAIKGVR